MTTQGLKKAINRKIKEGSSKKKIYDELSADVSVNKSILVKYLKNAMTLEERKSVKTYNVSIFLILLASFSTRLFVTFSSFTNDTGGYFATAVLVLSLLVSIFIIVSLLQFKAGIYKAIIYLSVIITMLNFASEKIGESINPLVLVDLGLILGLLVLSSIVSKKMVSSYSVQKERIKDRAGNIRLQQTTVFHDSAEEKQIKDLQNS